ncbi:DUF6745 domain-containing protein [Catenulispora rubra]|uniref:DUF6745 domain-containing protein n=1 Tax=Catenulispora rubra TaxID=280293 RepID=UPI0018925953|nr:hypothetical protein [Catenulispora rubra]
MGIQSSQLGEWLRDLPAVRQEWLDLQACTQPVDRYEAEFGVALAYETAGLKPPHTVVWAPDPALGAVIATVVSGFTPRASAKVWTEARQRARRSTGNTHKNRVWQQAAAGTRFSERERVDAAIRSAALGLAFTTRNSRTPEADGLTLAERRIEGARAKASMEVWGQHAFWSHGSLGQRRLGVRMALDALGSAAEKEYNEARRRHTPSYNKVRATLAWARNQHEGLQELALLDALARLHTQGSPAGVEGLVRVARSAGWWWPFRDVAVVCERPSLRKVDREGRLHAEDGPALVYPGGFSAYFWHGRIVPRWAVLEPTVARIGAEQNVEVRRCAIEALGWSRFTDEAGLKLVDECADPGNRGQRLALYSVPGKLWGMAANVLVCTNGTEDLGGGRHTFGLLVPVTVRAALGAAAWGYGLTAEEYAGLERRA